MSAIPKKELVKKRVKQTYEGYPAVTSVWQDPELEAMPDAPVAAPDGRSIDELMVAATSQATPGSRPIVDPAAPPREAFYGYIPDAPMRSKADEYETAAKLGLAKNIMAMGGLDGGTDPEAYVKARLAERARYEDMLNKHNMNKEAMDPTSATSAQQQAYLKSMGVDASGLGAQNIEALGVPGRATNLELKDRDIAFGREKAQMDNAAKIEAAKLKKRGGGGGVARGPAKWANPDGSVNWESPEAKDALAKTGNNQITAEKFLRNPKMNQQIEVATVKDAIKDPDQLRAQTIKYGEGLKDYNDLERVTGQLLTTFDKYESQGKRIPGIGVAGLMDKPMAWIAQNVGMDTPEGRDAQAIARLQAEAKQIYQRIKTGLHAGEREMAENAMITATATTSTPRQVKDAVAALMSYVKGGKSNLAASFGPDVVAAYEANRKATEAQQSAPAQQFVTVRHRGTGAVKQYSQADFETLSRKPSFKDFEVVR